MKWIFRNHNRPLNLLKASRHEESQKLPRTTPSRRKFHKKISICYKICTLTFTWSILKKIWFLTLTHLHWTQTFKAAFAGRTNVNTNLKEKKLHPHIHQNSNIITNQSNVILCSKSIKKITSINQTPKFPHIILTQQTTLLTHISQKLLM